MINTVLLVLILIAVLLKPDRNYKDKLDIITSKLWDIERTMIKRKVHKNIECPKCGGEGYMYMSKIHSNSEGLHFVEDPENLGHGDAYCLNCNGHGELTHDSKMIDKPVW
jgi:hypothetical protein